MFADHTATPLDELPLVTVDPTASPEAWPFAISAQAVDLFEAMPDQFTFDELLRLGDVRKHSAGKVALFLRQYEQFDMINIAGDVIHKTGQKPYF